MDNEHGHILHPDEELYTCGECKYWGDGVDQKELATAMVTRDGVFRAYCNGPTPRHTGRQWPHEDDICEKFDYRGTKYPALRVKNNEHK